jgi:hypothetical protein
VWIAPRWMRRWRLGSPVAAGVRRIDESQKPGDVEFEYAVRIGLVTLLERTGLKPFIEFELGRSAGRVLGGQTGHRLHPTVAQTTGADHKLLGRQASRWLGKTRWNR